MRRFPPAPATPMAPDTGRAGGANPSRPLTVRDLVAMDRISDPRVSPDGRQVAFIVSALNDEQTGRRSSLWLVGADAQGLRRLTGNDRSVSSPSWSADGGSICFLAARGGPQQVWRLPMQGGEAEALTAEPVDVGAYLLSPDGRHIAYALEVFPDSAGPADTLKRLDEIKGRKSSARVFERLFIRHWDAWNDGRRNHVFVRPLTGGEAVDVMRGMDADAPTRPFGGAEEWAFTPDGRGIVFTAFGGGRDEAWSTNTDLWLAPLDGSAPPRPLTAHNPAADTRPVFSPDGRWLAFAAQSRPGYESDRFRILLRAWPDGPDGAEREVAPGWDCSAGELVWSADGRTLYTTADDHGQHPLHAIDVATGAVRKVVAEGTARSPRLLGDRLVLGLDTSRRPVDLYTVRPDGGDLKPLTRFNADRLATVQMGDPEEMTFTGAGGDPVHAWVVKPVDFDPARKHPVALLIHGGPQGSWHNDFHYRWNPQLFAGHGYAVLAIDFHGSTGYGQAFCDAIRGDWGGKPFEDLQKGLEAALGRYAWMDGERVAALGASFGGYMINWIAGQWPDRFRCLVNHDGNLDERLAYYDTEELWFPEWDHVGTPWDNPESYEKHNPIRHVDRWKTPMLVIHGGMDFRVVETQGMSTFSALQRRGIPSKLLYFPDENHWVLKPQNSIAWYDTVLAWLDRWTGQAPPAAP